MNQRTIGHKVTTTQYLFLKLRLLKCTTRGMEKCDKPEKRSLSEGRYLQALPRPENKSMTKNKILTWVEWIYMTGPTSRYMVVNG